MLKSQVMAMSCSGMEVPNVNMKICKANLCCVHTYKYLVGLMN